MNDLKALAERLKTQAPHCSFTWGEDGLRVQSPCGEVRAAGDRVLFLGDVYRNLRMADSSSLCTAVALFAQYLEEGGPVEPRTREERCACNPTYRATAAALKKLDRRVLTVLAAVEAVLLAALVLSGQSILAMAMILALVGTAPWRANRTIHILTEHWVCPHCHAALPRMPHSTIALRYACRCPACGQKLETDPLSRYAHEPDVDQAARAPGNRACRFSGAGILLGALAGFALSPGDWALRLALFGAALTGLGLLFLPVRPPQEVTFSAGVRRRDGALVPAFFCWPLGLALLGMGVWSARQGLSAGYWAAAGLLLTALGARALLDRRNRALFFLSDGTLLRFDLWGRRQERTVQQIASVRSCPGRSLALLGEDGRVFFTARSGMCQFQRVRNWAEARQIPIQLVAPPVAGRSVQCWRNAFRSRMHLYLNAARVSLALALAALWAGCLLPPALFALGELRLGDTVLWMGAAPLPLMVCLVVFAPVTALGGLQEATPAWKAMHALLPYPLLALPAVLLAAMAPAAMDRFLFAEDSRAFPWLWAAFTLVPAALVCLRTPRPRRAAQTVILTALLMLTGYSTACAADLVLQNLAHTAAPVQTQGAAPLTVQRKDGVRFLVTDKRGSALASFDCCVI